jgi:hypothetical protein
MVSQRMVWLLLVVSGTAATAPTAAAAPTDGAPRPRVALCVVGLIRNQIGSTVARITKHIVENPQWDVDVFVETWSTHGVSRAQRTRLGPGHDNSGQLLDVKWGEVFPLAKLRHVRQESMPPNVSHYFHGLALPPALIRLSSSHYGSTLPNLRKTYQCGAAKRAWEDANGFIYDVVAKLRPDFVCADNEFVTFARAISRIVEHGRNSTAQPTPFYHGNPWPAVMVSDQSAVGTSAAMDVFMGTWSKLAAMFTMKCLPQAMPGCNYQMTDEKLMKVYLMCYAPFNHMPHYCCPPLQRRFYDRSVKQCGHARAPGGEDWDYIKHDKRLVAARMEQYDKNRAAAEASGKTYPTRAQTDTDNEIVCPPDSYAALHGELKGHNTRVLR